MKTKTITKILEGITMINIKYEVKLYCPKRIIDVLIPKDELSSLFTRYNPETYDYSGEIDGYLTAIFNDIKDAEEFEYKLLQLFDTYMNWEDNEVQYDYFRSMP